MLSIDGDTTVNCNTSTIKSRNQLLRDNEMWKARAFFLQATIAHHSDEIENTKRIYKEKIESTDSKIKEPQEMIDQFKDGESKYCIELEQARAMLESLTQKKATPLRYTDLYPGGILADHIDAFTFFKTIELNNAFLKVINYADGSDGAFPEGDGLCQNLRAYSHVTMAEQRGEQEPPCLDPDSEGIQIQRSIVDI